MKTMKNINTMKYQDYFGSIEYTDEDDCLFGRILGINDIISYEGQSIKELRIAFQESVEDYLETCKELGKNPDKPYSGRFVIRIDPSLHAKLATQAQAHKKSLNQYASEILAQASI